MRIKTANYVTPNEKGTLEGLEILALKRKSAGIVPRFWSKPVTIFCEHCGTIDSVHPAFEHEGVTWCAACAYANDIIFREHFEIIHDAENQCRS